MYLADEKLVWIGKGGERVCLIPKMANRHGLIAGATGTGKTITLKVLAEAFSDMGTPVFLADIKGDLSGMCRPGEDSPNIQKRVTKLGIDGFTFSAYPTRFFDVYGKQGTPVRTTISNMGPDLLARLLELNETQEGILSIIFKVADDNELLLLDLKDLKALTRYVGEHAAELRNEYGNVTSQSVGAIQRSLLRLEQSGGDIFFGEPALDIADWMSVDENGRGFINILDCVTLFQSPILYSTFLLWMLSELYEHLPEAGDLEKPKMVFFFDEAHLLFSDAPKALLQKVDQVVKLIRSKGVGVYFISQQPSDIPDSVLSQLGNKVQHALRAYTPNDQKALKAAAKAFRPNPEIDCEAALTELGTGEALISVLDENGVPGIVQRAFVLPPRSFMGNIDDTLRQQMIHGCPLNAKYAEAVDRESAYEELQEQAEQAEAEAKKAAEEAQQEQEREAREKEKEKAAKQHQAQRSRRASPVEKAMSATITSIGREVGRDIGKSLASGLTGSKKTGGGLLRGILGSLLK